MLDTLKIKLSIADRVYPLTIQPAQEEGLRKATQQINQMITRLEQSYSVKDKQDVLAMCALQLASQNQQKQIDDTNLNKTLQSRLSNLDDLLNNIAI